ncbi:helix-turn-helix domain-containing protein [Pseudonocardia phyllosphaerae]|uniref:helix-turn-helix domain-containing protein n=1 Tax=Pseudonocardia phyllosphaerae TaxID=3390502 RepID=UPI00397DA84D
MDEHAAGDTGGRGGDARGVPADAPGDPVHRNRRRQCELYGEPLGDRVRRLTIGLGISQARLAATIGISPAMLSQLVGARRIKIGDPAVLGRLASLDRVVAAGPVHPDDIPALLADVRAQTVHWGPAATAGECPPYPAAGHPYRGAGLAYPHRESSAHPHRGSSGGAHPHRGDTGAAHPHHGGSGVAHPHRGTGRRDAPHTAPHTEDPLRGISDTARLIAAAAVLAPRFPDVADALRRAATGR